MEQRDFHCPYPPSSEISAKPRSWCTWSMFELAFNGTEEKSRALLKKYLSTAGQEDPFEFDCSLILLAGAQGADKPELIENTIVEVIYVHEKRLLVHWAN